MTDDMKVKIDEFFDNHLFPTIDRIVDAGIDTASDAVEPYFQPLLDLVPHGNDYYKKVINDLKTFDDKLLIMVSHLIIGYTYAGAKSVDITKHKEYLLKLLPYDIIHNWATGAEESFKLINDGKMKVVNHN